MKGTKLYRNAAAVMLLLLLVCTTVIQLTHSHAVKQTTHVQIKKAPAHPHQQDITTSKAEAKCFICEYQLTRDADCCSTCFQTADLPFTEVNAAAPSSRLITAAVSNFESRGPPAGSVAVL